MLEAPNYYLDILNDLPSDQMPPEFRDARWLRSVLNSAIAELVDLRETNTRLNRRCTTAEAFVGKSIEQLRGAGQRTFGRMLANAAAEMAQREVDELNEKLARANADWYVLYTAGPENLEDIPDLAAAHLAHVDALEKVAKRVARLEGERRVCDCPRHYDRERDQWRVQEHVEGCLKAEAIAAGHLLDGAEYREIPTT